MQVKPGFALSQDSSAFSVHIRASMSLWYHKYFRSEFTHFCTAHTTPCNSQITIHSTPSKLFTLNHTMFNGLPVLGSLNGRVSFNTDILAQNGRLPTQHFRETTATVVQPTAVYASEPVYASAPGVPVQYAQVETRNPDQAYSKY